jgi:hypothetical protein
MSSAKLVIAILAKISARYWFLPPKALGQKVIYCIMPLVTYLSTIPDKHRQTLTTPISPIHHYQNQQHQMSNPSILHSSLATASQHYIITSILLLTLVASWKIIYRLYLHPLSKIPGPKIAAVTWLYEVYFDVWCGGKFVFEIGTLHEIYGMICLFTFDIWGWR